MAKKLDNTEEKIVAVEEALGKTEQFIEKNQKLLTIVIGLAIVFVLGFFGYNKLYVSPMDEEAQSQMFMAEMYFQQDSLDKALYGDGNYLGFIDIIDEYGITKSANLANYYAGICFLNKGEFDTAIDYLEDFSSDDEVLAPMAVGAIGDAYAEMENFEKAASKYLAAANLRENEFTTPTFLFKAGHAYAFANNYKKALPLYERIKKDFNLSTEGRDIDKYIAHAKSMAK